MTHQLREAEVAGAFTFDLKGPVQLTYFISTKLCRASALGNHTPHTPPRMYTLPSLKIIVLRKETVKTISPFILRSFSIRTFNSFRQTESRTAFQIAGCKLLIYFEKRKFFCQIF